MVLKDNPLGWLDWVLNGVEHANSLKMSNRIQ